MTDTRLGARLPRRDLLTRMPNHHLRNSPQLTVVFFTQTSDCAAAMQPEARCLLLVLFVCIVNLSNIVGVPPSASAGRRCLSKADAKVRTFSRTRKLFGDFFCKKGDFGAFFDLNQGHGKGIHIIYMCAREMDKPRSRAAGNRTEGAGREAREGWQEREGDGTPQQNCGAQWL